MNSVPVLFKKKEDCCACGACLNVCPRKAITMREDKCGFIYPMIDESICIRCWQCKKVCAFQNDEVENSPIECYAAISKNTEQAKNSASAGIFAAIATEIIENGGIIYGAAFDKKWRVHHISAETVEQLIPIQGSKYAHSDTERIYTEAEAQLKTGRKVLYSGTPCQIAGLQGYLGKEYENLLTVDIICHGVPSNKMFQDYLKTLEDKYGGKITAFTFRDKRNGWGLNGSATINEKTKRIWQSSSSYFYYFTAGWIYRENCYRCKYACSHRPADITLGDYWGIEKQHPEYIGKGGWDERKGISAVIINSKKGRETILSANIEIKESTFEKIAYANEQLSHPSTIGKRTTIIELYKQGQWKQIEKRFTKNIGLRRYSSAVKAVLPIKLKRLLKSR